MSLHRNRVQMTVTGTPGTGTITLNAATSGYQSFGTAYSSANATVDILITEGTSWEVARNCAYTHSGTTVTRGTLEASSSGSAVSFTSAAIVSVIATAASGNNWGLNEVQSNADAAVTGVVGTMHILDIGPFTADRDFTLPATCAIGDRVGVFIKTGDPSFELLLKPASGDTINGGSAGAEWSRLFITGECVIFRCIAADSEWIVEYDGRIPCAAHMYLAADEGSKTASTFLKVGLDAQLVNVGNIANTTNERVEIRRTGTYAVGAIASISCDINGVIIGTIYVNGVEERRLARAFSGTASTASVASGSSSLSLNAGDYVELYGWNAPNAQTHNGGNVGDACRLNVEEVL
jgi:hypothetical protein